MSKNLRKHFIEKMAVGDIIPDAAYKNPVPTRREAPHYFCSYTGPSMNPTLYEYDLLEVVSYKSDSTQVGDVIVFYSSQKKQLIVHRVIKRTSQKIYTRGDNNRHNDSDALMDTHIMGRVIAAWRGRKRRRVLGGLPGLFQANLNRIFRRGFSRYAGWSRILYRFGPQHNPFSQKISYWLKTRVVIFHSRDGSLSLQLFLGSKNIGRYSFFQKQWSIRHPYHLFVNERELPDASECELL